MVCEGGCQRWEKMEGVGMVGEGAILADEMREEVEAGDENEGGKCDAIEDAEDEEEA